MSISNEHRLGVYYRYVYLCIARGIAEGKIFIEKPANENQNMSDGLHELEARTQAK